MNVNVVFSLLKKEFLNIIRDRKSFIIMILLPLLMFPLLIGLMSIILTSFTKVDDTITFGVNYAITEDFQSFADTFAKDYKLDIIYEDEKTLLEMFEDEKLAVYVLKKDNNYEIHYDENSTSHIASSMVVENLYQEYQEKYISDQLANLNISYEQLKDSFKVTYVHESVTEMGSFVPSIISMVLVMIISSVCFSVAIDVTTSEKEKGTLETILSLPIKKSELITSKFITVFLLSSMSGILTYVSLFGTMFLASDIISMMGVSNIAISFDVLLVYLVSIILISLLFSGLLLSVTLFSKNLKEAQNSLYPLELFVTFISMLPMFGVSASLKYSIIPFVNISLLFNNALSSGIDWLFVLLTFASTICYSVLLIMIISKLYNQEDVLFNTKSMLYLSFKNGKSKTECFSVLTSIFLAIIIYLLGMYFSIIFITSSKYFLASIIPLTIGIVILIASLIVKLDIKKSFKLNKFKITRFFKSLMLYIGTYIIANQIVNIVSYIFPSIVEDYSAFESFLTFDNLYLAILVVAILPAIFEELLFRGVIYNSFNKKYGVKIAIVASALIFGIYHMNWIQGIFAFILGSMLAYVYFKTNSLFVPIILHFINNLISVLVSHFNILNFDINNLTMFFIIIGCFALCSLSIILFQNKAKE